MKKFFILAATLLLFASAATAQEVTVAKKGNKMTPSKGDFSIGFTFNPVALSKKISYQPGIGTFAGDWVGSQAEYPHQMFFLSTEPLASFMLKYRFTDHWGIRGSLGFTGSRTNYKEYVKDDFAMHRLEKSAGKYTENLAVDVISAKLNAFTIGISAEYTKNFGALSFIAGFGIQYAVGGGSMSFKYGNDYINYEDDGQRWINYNPTTTAYTQMKTTELEQGKLNGYNADDKYGYHGFNLNQLTDGSTVRPTDRYNIGYCNGIGFTCDMGIEWFFAGKMSLTAAITFTPLMIMFQPQTYATFEGIQTKDITWNNGSAQTQYREKDQYEVVEFSHLVSPGSTALLYGTENLGFRIGFNYYL